MRSFVLSKNAIPIHLAFIAGYLACVSSTPEGIASYLPLAWFIAGLIEVMLLFPAARKGEDALMARSRVKKAIFKDPIFILSLLGVAFLLIQTVNGPREAFFNVGTGNWAYSRPPVPDFPSSIDRLLSLQGLFWGLLSGTVLLAFRNCIGKKGRTNVLKYMVYISGVVSFIGIIQYAKTPAVDGIVPNGFSFFESSFEAGVYFLMHFCLAIALLLQELNNESSDKATFVCLSSSVAFTALGVFYSLSVDIIFVYFIVLLLTLAYAMPYILSRLQSATIIKILGSVLALVGVALFLNFIAYPGNQINKTIQNLVSKEKFYITFIANADNLADGQFLNEDTFKKAESATDYGQAALDKSHYEEIQQLVKEKIQQNTIEKVGWRIFKDNPLCGVGAWCTGAEDLFGHYIEDDEWENFTDENSATSICYLNNDFLQFLCEFGIIGTVLICSPFIYLLVCVLSGIIRAAFPPKTKVQDSTSSSENENIPFQDRITPLIYFSIIAIVSSLVLASRLTVFHNPVIILTYVITFASLGCFLPKPIKKTESASSRNHSFFNSSNTQAGFDPRRETEKLDI